ncbi:XRE family transcriptional regulator [Sphingomonas sp. ABOLH]|nr:XRE family transcriptional regulator [Sphingomonas sp. ABOLH]
MSTAVPAIVALPVGLVIVRPDRTIGIPGDVGGPRSSDRWQSGCRIDIRSVAANSRVARERPVVEPGGDALEQSHVSTPDRTPRRYTFSVYCSSRSRCSGVPAPPVPSDLHARIVAALTVARRDARLRQVDLAKRLGWQQAYVSRYETGERQLSVDEYVAVALAIGVDPVALLSELLSQNCS